MATVDELNVSGQPEESQPRTPAVTGVTIAVSHTQTERDALPDILGPEPFAARLAKVRAAGNLLLEAARVLLRSQADIPGMDPGAKGVIPILRQLLKEEMKTFQKLCEQTSIRRDHMIGARYCLCTALDEAIMETPWGRTGDNGVSWGTRGLATNFHEDRDGGTKIYLLVARLTQDPEEHHDLLEVIYHLLSFGFEGRYRNERDGRRKHEAVRQRIYTEIMARRAPVPTELSPHARSDVPPKATLNKQLNWRRVGDVEVFRS